MIHVPMLNRITAVTFVCLLLAATGLAQKQLTHQPIAVTIMQAEDERRWSNDLMQLLSNQFPVNRKRAALAAGRIGDEGRAAAARHFADEAHSRGRRRQADRDSGRDQRRQLTDSQDVL